MTSIPASPLLHIYPTNIQLQNQLPTIDLQDKNKLIIEALNATWGDDNIPYDDIETAIQAIQHIVNLPAQLIHIIKNKYPQHSIPQQAFIDEINQFENQRHLSSKYTTPITAKNKVEIKLNL